MNEKITREWLVDHGFKSSGDRVYFLKDKDLGYDLGIVKRAIVKVKYGFILLRDIKCTNELNELHYILTGEKLIN
jgi:hypothetical protein